MGRGGGHVTNEQLHNKNVNMIESSQLFKTYNFHYVLRLIVCITEHKQGNIRECCAIYIRREQPYSNIFLSAINEQEFL